MNTMKNNVYFHELSLMKGKILFQREIISIMSDKTDCKKMFEKYNFEKKPQGKSLKIS